ncbi:MAG: hypothetical protein KF768_13325 [Phycisphaeraceae bacterium]|nr:hypothetical protein [Phycisphaeraceae bacterium]
MGFRHEVIPAIDEFPQIALIDLDERLRIYVLGAPGVWTPLMLELFDKRCGRLACLRIDAPPSDGIDRNGVSGRVIGRLPVPMGSFEKCVVTRLGDVFNTSDVTPRIGVPRELSDGQPAIDALLSSDGVRRSNAPSAATRFESLTVTPAESHLCAIVLVNGWVGTVPIEPWQGSGPAPDDHWLDHGPHRTVRGDVRKGLDFYRRFIEQQRIDGQGH